MIKKYALILFVALALMLSACTRAASTAIPGTPTPDANFPQPVATNLNTIDQVGTQTAIAAFGLPLPTAAVAAPGQPTFTPLAGIDSTPVVSTPLPSPTPEIAAINTAIPQSGVAISKPASYSLHEGEFPYCIARRFNVDPDQLLALNGLNSYQNYFAPGTQLSIPQSGGIFPGPRALKAHPTQYTVRVNDTIYSIACEFGDVDPMSIASANNLSGSYNLTTGASIQIP